MKSLNEVVKIVGLKRRAIQEYEDAGLANKPTNKNKYGHLLYDTPEIERLWQLKFYKELGYEIPEIEEIRKKGTKAEKEELGGVIDKLKEKRDKLNNLISIAEMMNETGWSFNDLRNSVITTDDIQADDIFSVMGAVASIMKFDDMEDCFVENVISDAEWELMDSHMEKVLECFEENIDFTDEVVQSEVTNLHKLFSKATSESVYILQTLITTMAAIEELKDEMGADTSDYIIGALRYYCDEHKDNPTDMALIDAFSNIEKLARSKHAAGSKEVQNEVNNIYLFFDNIKMFKPEIRNLYVKNIGRVLGSQAYKNVIDGGAARGIAWYISRAIEIYYDNMEEKTNG